MLVSEALTIRNASVVGEYESSMLSSLLFKRFISKVILMVFH